MKTVEFYIHVFAHEMHDFQRTVEMLKRNLSFVEEDVVFFNITLNVSEYHYDWKQSKLPPAFFVNQFEGLCNMLPNVTKDVEYFEEIGCNTVRRNAARTCEKDFVGYLDLDLHFSIYTLHYMLNAIDKLCIEPLDWNRKEQIILSGQIPRLWDDSWNIISNDEFIKMGVESKIWLKLDPYSLDKLVYNNLETLGLKQLPYVKIGGGWMNLIETSILRDVDVPDSLGAYGRDDTFVERSCNLLNENKITNIKQYVIDGLLVCEGRKYESYEPYLQDDMIKLNTQHNSYKEQRAMEAQNNFDTEITKMYKRVSND